MDRYWMPVSARWLIPPGRIRDIERGHGPGIVVRSTISKFEEGPLVGRSISKSEVAPVAVKEATVRTAARMRDERQRHAGDGVGAVCRALVHFGSGLSRDQHVDLHVGVRVRRGTFGRK